MRAPKGLWFAEKATAQISPETEAVLAALCAPTPTIGSNTLVALLKIHVMTFNKPLATVTRDWIDAVTYGQTSGAIEFLVNHKRWLERVGNDRFRITEAGVIAARATLEFAGGLK